jgi:hypothetical protein
MPRYFTRRTCKQSLQVRADWIDEDMPLIPSLTVDDHDAVETGIVDASGDPIMRSPNPMGFGKDADW